MSFLPTLSLSGNALSSPQLFRLHGLLEPYLDHFSAAYLLNTQHGGGRSTSISLSARLDS
ncbi:hypothetical protein I7I53_00795 [Histoplasma capsulatum var. duboisii H88]|uniref:Uncharacterized protein n=1 Tax=Ajellomyces capsulatus (strain H88) TaxID=544711 RepID=A0A8A1LND3_AJEC8|nr:hypothetical protein I7I53_00795 [Histoplasma capsulatum var. duboisii H88]